MTKSSQKPDHNTHHWTWRLEVRNDFRDSIGFIEYLWYSDLAEFFTACWVGSSESSQRGEIQVLLRGKPVGSYQSKKAAWDHVLGLARQAPAKCRRDVLDHLFVLHDALFGRGKYPTDPTHPGGVP